MALQRATFAEPLSQLTQISHPVRTKNRHGHLKCP